jgi:hypothetical protein
MSSKCGESRFKNYTQSMHSGGKDNLQAGVGVEIQRGSFAGRNDDERNQAPARNETSDGRILEGSGWFVDYPEVDYPECIFDNTSRRVLLK